MEREQERERRLVKTSDLLVYLNLLKLISYRSRSRIRSRIRSRRNRSSSF